MLLGPMAVRQVDADPLVVGLARGGATGAGSRTVGGILFDSASRVLDNKGAIAASLRVDAKVMHEVCHGIHQMTAPDTYITNIELNDKREDCGCCHRTATRVGVRVMVHRKRPPCAGQRRRPASAHTRLPRSGPQDLRIRRLALCWLEG